MPNFDVIVLGLGGMGSAAAHACAARGWKVLGLEQFPLVHDQGSSHGHSRIIRQAYYEHPAYVPLVRQALTRWEALQEQHGSQLLFRCPCANIGPPNSEIVLGVQRSALEHQLPITVLNSADWMRRYPAFWLPENYVAVVEETAGWLRVEDCVHAQLDAASRLGAQLHDREPARSWTSRADKVEVVTDKDRYRAARLIITAGPWTTQVLSVLKLPLNLMRQVQLWFNVSPAQEYSSARFPIFIVDAPDGSFYGIPADAGPGLKLAQHYGAPELSTLKDIRREPAEADTTAVRRFAQKFLPGVHEAPLVSASVCIYTLSPDRHFIIDRHPHFENVALACGFSGHGFKFAPVVGEMLTGLLEAADCPQELELFRLNRFAGA